MLNTLMMSLPCDMVLLCCLGTGFGFGTKQCLKSKQVVDSMHSAYAAAPPRLSYLSVRRTFPFRPEDSKQTK